MLRASFGVTFGDLLRDRQLQTVFRLGTDLDDFAAQMSPTSTARASGTGASSAASCRRASTARGAAWRAMVSWSPRETTHLRYLHQWVGVAARYNIDRSRRIELGVGVRRTGFDWQTVTRITDGATRCRQPRCSARTPAGRPVYLAEAQIAFVHDTAVSGPTSPGARTAAASRGRAGASAACRSPTSASTRGATSCRCGPLTIAARVAARRPLRPERRRWPADAAGARPAVAGARLRPAQLRRRRVRPRRHRVLDARRAERQPAGAVQRRSARTAARTVDRRARLRAAADRSDRVRRCRVPVDATSGRRRSSAIASAASAPAPAPTSAGSSSK